jgi:hypothetical protein
MRLVKLMAVWMWTPSRLAKYRVIMIAGCAARQVACPVWLAAGSWLGGRCGCCGRVRVPDHAGLVEGGDLVAGPWAAGLVMAGVAAALALLVDPGAEADPGGVT